MYTMNPMVPFRQLQARGADVTRVGTAATAAIVLVGVESNVEVAVLAIA